MIIYNNKKEFLGIDEENLKALGFSSLADLQAEAADFADLFVKIPGYVHNFRHVHWIDFVLCEDDKKACKAIIHAKGKNYNCFLDIKIIYLTSSPHSKSYILYLNNLRALSSNENNEISGEIQARVAPITAVPTISKIETEKIETINQPTVVKESIIKIEDDQYETDENLSLDAYEPSQAQLDAIGEPDVILTSTIDDEIEVDLNEIEIEEEQEKIIEKEPIREKEENVKTISINLEKPNLGEDLENYTFDINESAEALEMDVADIKDFINDFINQAKDFKDRLYDAVSHDNMITLKSLSHQLKGVAANLRIHDCETILVKINKANNFTTSKADLDTFYMLVARLAGGKANLTQSDENQLNSEANNSGEFSNKDSEIEKNPETIKTEEDDDDLIVEIGDSDILPEIADAKIADDNLAEITDT